MDLASINAYGRPIVQPTAANREAMGLRPVTDPREVAVPATPLAAAASAELRVSTGPRASSSTSDTRENKEQPGVAGRKQPHAAAHHQNPEGDRGAQVDVTI